MAVGDHYCLKWNNYQTNMVSALEGLKQEGDFVDVTLSCEGKTIKAHKVVLSACSQYFRQVLKDNPCSHPVVILRDAPFEDVRGLVDYAYCGQVNVPPERLCSLLNTARVLSIKGLSEHSLRPNHEEDSTANGLSASTTMNVMRPMEPPIKVPVPPTSARRCEAAAPRPPASSVATTGSISLLNSPVRQEHRLQEFRRRKSRQAHSEAGETGIPGDCSASTGERRAKGEESDRRIAQDTSEYSETPLLDPLPISDDIETNRDKDDNDNDNLALDLSLKEGVGGVVSRLLPSTKAESVANVFQEARVSPAMNPTVRASPGPEGDAALARVKSTKSGAHSNKNAPNEEEKKEHAAGSDANEEASTPPLFGTPPFRGDEPESLGGPPRKRWRSMQPRECVYCFKTFSNSFNLKQHTINVHVQSVGVACAICKKVVKNKWYLRKHLVTAHNAPLKRGSKNKSSNSSSKSAMIDPNECFDNHEDASDDDLLQVEND